MHRRVPRRIIARCVKYLPEFVLAFRRSDKRCAALTICDRWSNDCRPCVRWEVSWLIQHHRVKVQSSHRVSCLGTKQSYASAIREIDAQLRLIDLDARYINRELLAVIPRYGLRLPIGRRNVRHSDVGPVNRQCIANQVINRGNCLAAPPMRHQTGKSTRSIVKRDHDIPRRVRNRYLRHTILRNPPSLQTSSAHSQPP